MNWLVFHEKNSQIRLTQSLRFQSLGNMEVPRSIFTVILHLYT